ncbi:MAG: hypothetical protein M3R09_02115 [Actinomycetota bacterium]|nr:hypothetical protein [Geodermatophilaceae bacterium]MDQ3028833.1 hypothetical protein [Actinomycetota bacterium]
MSEGSAGGDDRPAQMPREVRLASALLTALGAVLVVNAVVALLYRDDLRAAAEDGVSTVLSSAQVSAILIVVTVLLLLLGGLLVLTGAQIRRGRQWARVLAFVTAGILILITGIGALAGGGLLAAVLLGAAVGVVALLMQSSVAAFFEHRAHGR